MNNRDILEIQNFNRSVLTKNSYTKSEIEYILHIYNICLQAREDSYLRTILNNKFATIVTLAQKQITAFSNGKLHLSPDAYKPMGEFIRKFGQEYVTHSSSLKYEFTPAARRAQIMLNKMSSRLSVNKQVRPKTFPQSNITLPKVIKAASKKSTPVQKENVVAKLRKHMPTTADAKKIIQASNNKLVVLKNKVDSYVPVLEQHTRETIKHQAKIIKHIGNEASEVGGVVCKEVSNIVRRYGTAVALLLGMCGTGNMSNIGAKDVFKSIKEHKIEYITKTSQAIETTPKTKVLTTNDFVLSNIPNAKDNHSWFQNQGLELDFQEKYIAPKTIADLTFKGYKFTKEDLQALEVSEQGAELALHARKVVRNMNYPGYCYRGVKRMFNLANLGEMHGRSAYMAKKYLDNNPNFVRINCDVSDLKYLPKGTVVVFDKGKRGTHPHGHIGVLDEVNGKMVDRSSKTYNVRSTLGGYSSVHVYIHADTPLPQRVQDNINKIMVLKDKEQPKNNPQANYLFQTLMQNNAIVHT